MTGTFKRIVRDKGFAFIKENGSDREYFMHRTSLKNAEFDRIQEGDAVTFDEESSAKGLRATNVQVQ